MAAASLRKNKKAVSRPIGRDMRAAMDGPQGFLQGDGALRPHPLFYFATRNVVWGNRSVKALSSSMSEIT